MSRRTSKRTEYLTLAELAAACNTSVHAARNYKVDGLIRGCARTPGGYELFDHVARQRLRLVRLLREAGVAVCDIKRLVTALDGNARQLDSEIGRLLLEIAAQHEALSAVETELAALRSGEPSPAARDPIGKDVRA